MHLAKQTVTLVLLKRNFFFFFFNQGLPAARLGSQPSALRSRSLLPSSRMRVFSPFKIRFP